VHVEGLAQLTDVLRHKEVPKYLIYVYSNDLLLYAFMLLIVNCLNYVLAQSKQPTLSPILLNCKLIPVTFYLKSFAS